MTDKQPAAPEEGGESNVYFIRGQKVMLSMHLAEIYGVGPRALVETIERNIEHFPEGSVFQLKAEEIADLKLQPANSDQEAPYAFTRQGVIIFSGILADEGAIHNGDESSPPTCSCRE